MNSLKSSPGYCFFVRFEASHNKTEFGRFSGHRTLWFDKRPTANEIYERIGESAKDCDYCKGNKDNWDIFPISINTIPVTKS